MTRRYEHHTVVTVNSNPGVGWQSSCDCGEWHCEGTFRNVTTESREHEDQKMLSTSE